MRFHAVATALCRRLRAPILMRWLVRSAVQLAQVCVLKRLLDVLPVLREMRQSGGNETLENVSRAFAATGMSVPDYPLVR